MHVTVVPRNATQVCKLTTRALCTCVNIPNVLGNKNKMKIKMSVSDKRNGLAWHEAEVDDYDRKWKVTHRGEKFNSKKNRKREKEV